MIFPSLQTPSRAAHTESLVTPAHFDARNRPSEGLQVYFKVNNISDKKYEKLGVLGEKFFVNGTFDATNDSSEQFRSIGAKRVSWLGVIYQFGSRKADRTAIEIKKGGPWLPFFSGPGSQNW